MENRREQMNKISEGTASAQRLLGQLHRVDTCLLEHGETRSAHGNMMQIDVAVPDKYEDEDEPVEWTIEAVMLLLCGAGVMALIMVVIWGTSIFVRMG
jgi:hypothetical protein